MSQMINTSYAYRHLNPRAQTQKLLAIHFGHGSNCMFAGRIDIDIWRLPSCGAKQFMAKDAVDQDDVAIEVALLHVAEGTLSAGHNAHDVGLHRLLYQ